MRNELHFPILDAVNASCASDGDILVRCFSSLETGKILIDFVDAETGELLFEQSVSIPGALQYDQKVVLGAILAVIDMIVAFQTTATKEC